MPQGRQNNMQAIYQAPEGSVSPPSSDHGGSFNAPHRAQSQYENMAMITEVPTFNAGMPAVEATAPQQTYASFRAQNAEPNAAHDDQFESARHATLNANTVDHYAPGEVLQ
jgi:hypothetical protein